MEIRGWLLLSGGGDKEQTVDIDRKFFSLLHNGGKILYIQAALPEDDTTVSSCKEWFSGMIAYHNRGDLSFSVVTFIDDIPKGLRHYDAVYIGGGNTYRLLQFLMKNNWKRELGEYLENGGIVYGGSAGAIVMGGDIATVSEENEIGLSCSVALGFVPNLSIRCHFQEVDVPLLIDLPRRLGMDVVALTEESGVLLHGNMTEFFGKAIIFSNGKGKSFS